MDEKNKGLGGGGFTRILVVQPLKKKYKCHQLALFVNIFFGLLRQDLTPPGEGLLPFPSPLPLSAEG